MVAHRLKSSHSPSDCLPPSLLKNIFDPIGPFIQRLMNSSVDAGCAPSCFKQVTVQPLLKKHSLDATVLANYWTILKLPVLLKALEKLVYSQLQVHLDHNGIAEVLIWL